MDAVTSEREAHSVYLEGINRLYEVGNRCACPGNDMRQCLDEVIEVAIALTSADKGNLQILDRQSSTLKIAAQRGFEKPFLDFFNDVQTDDASACAMALQSSRRIIVEDVSCSPLFCGHPSLQIMLAASVQAVQSTPLISSSGTIIGMISTHFSRPHRPTNSELRLIDLLARQVADYLERKQIEVTLQQRQEWMTGQREALEMALDGAPLESSLGILVRTADNQLGEGVRSAFYLADEEGVGLHHIVGMSADYAKAIDGLKIGPESLACGLAAHLGRPVVTHDVNEDPSWAPWLWMAEKYGYRGCWSFPIHTAIGKFIGSFAVYWPQPCEAKPEHLEIISLVTQSAAIIISKNTEVKERHRAEKKLEESEKRLLTIIEQLPAGVGVMDRNGKWTLTNSLMEHYVPVAIPSTLPERIPYWRAWDKDGNAVLPENWPGKRALRGETVIPGMDMLCTGDNGIDVWLRVSSAPLRDDNGEILGACSVAQDITLLQKVEQALRDADRRKDEFLATLAHELRNPLAPIRNGLHILRKAGDHKNADMIHEMLERQVNHMVRLVDDLMEVSRITGGKVELRKELVGLTSILHNAVEISGPLINASRHQLVINSSLEPLTVKADPVRLAQVIANLLNNAAKYTHEEGQISLTTYREGNHAVISVRDNGMGIPSAMLPKIFDLFTQVERTYNHSQGGLGIGLTLVRSLVEMHGGSVEAKSDGSGKGSEFLVRLPVAEKIESIDFHSSVNESITLFPQRILLVDDNRDAAETLGMVLNMLGIDVCIVPDGPAALETFGKYQPDVVLLDIGMPGMDGYEVARRMRQQPDGEFVTVIAVTGWGQEEDRRLSEEAGIDHHLVKPLDITVLKQLLIKLGERI